MVTKGVVKGLKGTCSKSHVNFVSRFETVQSVKYFLVNNSSYSGVCFMLPFILPVPQPEVLCNNISMYSEMLH